MTEEDFLNKVVGDLTMKRRIPYNVWACSWWDDRWPPGGPPPTSWSGLCCDVTHDGPKELDWLQLWRTCRAVDNIDASVIQEVLTHSSHMRLGLISRRSPGPTAAACGLTVGLLGAGLCSPPRVVTEPPNSSAERSPGCYQTLRRLHTCSVGTCSRLWREQGAVNLTIIVVLLLDGQLTDHSLRKYLSPRPTLGPLI